MITSAINTAQDDNIDVITFSDRAFGKSCHYHITLSLEPDLVSY